MLYNIGIKYIEIVCEILVIDACYVVRFLY